MLSSIGDAFGLSAMNFSSASTRFSGFFSPAAALNATASAGSSWAGAAGFSSGRTDNHRTARGHETPASEASAAELTGLGQEATLEEDAFWARHAPGLRSLPQREQELW